MNEVLAVILGGGQGSRLWPLTKYRSKPAVPIGGKYRLIDIPVSNCLHGGVRRIYVLTQFNSASLNRHIARAYRFDSFTGGFVEILAAEQTEDSTDWYQGTADAVRQQMRHLRPGRHTHYLILSGDHLYRMDYGAFIRSHRDRDADVTIAVKPVGREEASSFGILRTDAEDRIIDFVEKPTDEKVLQSLETVGPDGKPAYLASMGIYVFGRKVLENRLEEIDGDDFGKQIIPQTIATHNVFAHRFSGYWEDIGTIGSFYRANLQITEPNTPFTFYDPRSPVYTRPRFLAASWIDGCALSQSKIADGCSIQADTINHSVIGLRSIVGPGTRIEDAVLMGADYYESREDRAKNRSRNKPNIGIGPGCEIRGAIIDKNARIGKEVRIINKEGVQEAQQDDYAIRDGIVVIPKDTVIPAGTVI